MPVTLKPRSFFFFLSKKIYCPSWTASKWNRKRKIQKKVDRNFHCVFHFYRVGIKREGIKNPLRNKLVYDDETSSILMNIAGARTRTRCYRKMLIIYCCRWEIGDNGQSSCWCCRSINLSLIEIEVETSDGFSIDSRAWWPIKLQILSFPGTWLTRRFDS